MIHRRFVLTRDPPFDVDAALTEIARLKGWGASEMAFVLNVSRGTLRAWRERGSRPNIDDGDAIRKLLNSARVDAAAQHPFQNGAIAPPEP